MAPKKGVGWKPANWPGEERISFTLRVSPGMKARLDLEAQMRDTNTSELVRQVLAAWFKSLDRQAGTDKAEEV
jgi:predicted transcriptional regulator